MAQPLQSRIPPLTLDSGCTVVFEAISPTTGAAITGVTVTNVAIYGQHNPGPGALASDVAPLWLPIPDFG